MSTLTELTLPTTRTATASEPPPRMRRARSLWWLASLPFLAFLGLPVLVLVLRASPTGVLANLQQPVVYQAIGLSLSTSLLAMALAVIFGTPVAALMARRNFPFKRALDTLIDLPTVMPPAVAGVALLLAFGRRGLLGPTFEAMGISIAFTTVAVVIAQTFISAPFYIKSAIQGFAGIDRELEEAAGLDGAGRVALFRHVIVPLAWSSLASGAVMTFARALGEFGATIIFAGNFPGRTQTMPLAIYIGFEIELDVALTLAVILLGFSFATLIIVKWLVRQR
jgi:molybdate transport system permease protein